MLSRAFLRLTRKHNLCYKIRHHKTCMKQLMEFKYKLKPQIEFLKNGKVLTDGENYLLDFLKVESKAVSTFSQT